MLLKAALKQDEGMLRAVDVNAMDVRRFERDGFLVVPAALTADARADIEQRVRRSLEPLLAPVEYEADVGYPGAPARGAAGGNTPRRLLHALSRDDAMRAFATSATMGAWMRPLLCASNALVSQCHHNCVMTKYPGHSSSTGWHQDIRYWNFDRPELISAWLALGHETADNGGLRVIPGSQNWQLDRGRLDATLFLREDLGDNVPLLADAVQLTLAPGDLLLFHSRLFHAAGRNMTETVKLSLVFTYHAADNHPIPGTRSANYPSLPVA